MAISKWTVFHRTLFRKKVFEADELEGGNLKRCLNRWDLTGLGLGSTLGVGFYVVVGAVALKIAGPSVILSFLIAAVASLFAGLCYAEFGSRVPRAGTGYIYTYVTVGEFVAFLIGWNMILEALFGAASVAKGLSTYVDSMVDGSMSAWFTSFVPLAPAFLSSHFDFFAFLIVIALGVLLAFGVRESSVVNNFFAMVNMLVIAFVIFAGAFKARPGNWSIPQDEVPPDHGTGGFFPYGFWGTLKGAAICFYGFVGFDVICTVGEEVREPRRSIPISILLVLGIVFISYAGVSTVVTMMVPYYLLDRTAAVATAFTTVGWDWARWIISIGAVFGICASLFGYMFTLPRLLYAMASDGLFLHWFAKVSAIRRSPAIATIVPTIIMAFLAAIVELEQLILTMCIGTFISYTIVATCVVLLRYRSNYSSELRAGYVKQMFGFGDKLATRTTSLIVVICLLLFICLCVATALVGSHVARPAVPAAVLHALALLTVLVMALQPQAKEELAFVTPLVPFIPCVSIYCNINLMILVNIDTWIRVVVWILIGIPFYILFICCYKRNKNNLEENVKHFAYNDKNGKMTVQIVIESPTPPGTMKMRSNYGGDQSKEIRIETDTEYEDIIAEVRNGEILKTEEIIVQPAIVENNEEKEAKIIDLLDQVLQAEEDSYAEIISLKEQQEQVDIVANSDQVIIPHRKSLSELSDAGSDASLSNQGLSKYDVVAQVHREDLPKVNEEEEKNDKESDEVDNEMEQVTVFIDSETNSRTDESGYSDTLDRNALNDSIEDAREETPYIPTPPPLDENYFTTPYFKKSYTIPARPSKKSLDQEEEVNKPRDSIKSRTSQDDGNIVFGSDRQMIFMSRLSNIFQNKMTQEEEDLRKRSHSTGNMVEGAQFALAQERPSLFLELRKEITSMQSAPNLRPVIVQENKQDSDNEEEVEDDTSLARHDLKSKLENIFATGGPMLIKPRLIKSNPPAPEEVNQTDNPSTESIAKLPKMEKNDTLKRQKAKFGEVLNSFRMSWNKDDDV